MKTLAVSISLALFASAPPIRAAEAPRGFQPPRIVKTVEPEFPPTLYQVYRRGGSVNLIIDLDERGNVSESLILASTDPRFDRLVLDALKEWKFEPARWDGRPTAIILPLNFQFEVKGVVISSSWADNIDSTLNSLRSETGGSRLVTLRQLDRPLLPVRTVSPGYPTAVANRIQGEVTVEFFVDEGGSVRMPSVIGLPPKILADLATAAVRQWTFEPPTSRGRPALVRVRQLFRFESEVPST